MPEVNSSFPPAGNRKAMINFHEDVAVMIIIGALNLAM